MSAPEEIVPGVYGIDLGFVNAFVLVDEAVTLVDTGIPRRAGRITAALRDLGREAVANVALTHHHPDHRGGAAALGDGARVFVHRLDAPVVTGERPPPGPAVGGIRKLAFTVLSPAMGLVLGSLRPVAVDREIDDGEEIPDTGGLRAVHTPGHTAGHLSYLHPDKRLLFVGDAASNVRKLGLPPPYFTEDMEQTRATLGEIAALDFDVAVFGHGSVLRGKANADFRKLADSLAP